MERLQNVTLEEAHEYVKTNSFALWIISGNYMNVECLVDGEQVETHVFLSESIILLGLSVKKEGVTVLGSRADFIDIWPSVKTKYPQLFQEKLKGELWLIP